MNDELIYQSKKGIIDFYDDTKFELEIDCQEVLERLEQKQKDTTNILKQFVDLLKRNNDVYEIVMNQFNQFIESTEENLLNQSSLNELMDQFIQSTVYISRISHLNNAKSYQLKWGSEDGVGVFIHCDYRLTPNQLNFIKVRMIRDEFNKDIKLCLDEVNFENINIFSFRKNKVYFFYIN